MKRKISIILIFVGAIAVLIILAALGLLPCGIKLLFGIPCPTCGMTRAYFSLISGDLHAAFAYQPLFWLLPLCLILCVFIKNTNARRAVFIICGAAYFIVYIIRMFMYFPDTAPMDFSSDAVIIKIFERIFQK